MDLGFLKPQNLQGSCLLLRDRHRKSLHNSKGPTALRLHDSPADPIEASVLNSMSTELRWLIGLLLHPVNRPGAVLGNCCRLLQAFLRNDRTTRTKARIRLGCTNLIPTNLLKLRPQEAQQMPWSG